MEKFPSPLIEKFRASVSYPPSTDAVHRGRRRCYHSSSCGEGFSNEGFSPQKCLNLSV